MPVILAQWEDEIQRIMDLDEPGQKNVCRTLSQCLKIWAQWYSCHPSHYREEENRKITVQVYLGQSIYQS
jgi:hypothetical protein